ncbi:MAG TPA: hypothetical protein VHZ50_05135 [Puia sp.]|nr:hypothetical protein [Puia sp.]
MDNLLPNRALTNWKKSEISLTNYKNYLNRKTDKFQLTIVDLLYISNFKGGNATINVEEELLKKKLKSYSDIFIQIDNLFKNKTLAQTTESDLEKLIYCINNVVQLCLIEETAIDGFKASFLSALLHSYFPDLIPILDRRLLINLNLVQKIDLQKSGQVNKIEKFYPILISKFRDICKLTNQTIRQIDQEYFIKKLAD